MNGNQACGRTSASGSEALEPAAHSIRRPEGRALPAGSPSHLSLAQPRPAPPLNCSPCQCPGDPAKPHDSTEAKTLWSRPALTPGGKSLFSDDRGDQGFLTLRPPPTSRLRPADHRASRGCWRASSWSSPARLVCAQSSGAPAFRFRHPRDKVTP